MRFYPRYLVGQEVKYQTHEMGIKHPDMAEGETVKITNIYNGENDDGVPYETYVIVTKNGLVSFIDHSYLTK